MTSKIFLKKKYKYNTKIQKHNHEKIISTLIVCLVIIYSYSLSVKLKVESIQDIIFEVLIFCKKWIQWNALMNPLLEYNL